MKIVYILNSAQPGGMEQHTLDLAQSMIEKGHKVWIWLPDGEINQWFKNIGAQVVNSRISFDIDPLYIFKLAQFLKKEKIDILHAHELKAVANALLAGFITRTPVKISHTHTPISTWHINEVVKKFTVLGYSLVVNLFSTTEIALTLSRKHVKEKEGIKESKITVIPNGLNVSKFDIPSSQKELYRKEILNRYHIPEDAFIFGNVSRLTVEKGHDVLIEGFSKFLEYSIVDKEKIYLLIAGGGALEEKYRNFLKEKGLENRVIITGVFPEEDLVKFYSAFNTFVFTSLAEGFGIVLIEAMYSELPVICSDLEVLQEVGGSTVMYFECGDAGDLAEKMLNLYQKKDKLSELEHGARERVLDLYSMDKFAETYEKLYFDLLEKKS